VQESGGCLQKEQNMTAAVKSCPRNGLGFLEDCGSGAPSNCRGLRNGRGGQGRAGPSL